MGICCGNINYQETLCLRRMAKNLYYGSDIDDIDDGLSVMTENISDIWFYVKFLFFLYIYVKWSKVINKRR